MIALKCQVKWVVVCVSFFLMMAESAVAGKTEIYTSLDKVQTAIETRVPAGEVFPLLNKALIEIIKSDREEEVDEKFILSATVCHVSLQTVFNASTFPGGELDKTTEKLFELTRSKLAVLRGML